MKGCQPRPILVQWLSTLTAQRSASTRYSDKRSLSARTTSPNMIRMVTDEQVAEARRLLPLFDGVIEAHRADWQPTGDRAPP